ncbi:MAG: hypothetical protein U1B30_16030 [Pseudomonadota bacterium]|nr:hypothetical protein [Pseudomonadota bacterium]
MATDQEEQIGEIIAQMLQDCMDDPDALSCALETIESIPDEMKDLRPRLVLFTQDGCGPCQEGREKYQGLIQQGKVTELDANTPEGIAIMSRNNLDATPSLVLLDCHDNLIGELFDSNEVEGEDIPPFVDNTEAPTG